MEDIEIVIDSISDGVEILLRSLQCAIWFVTRKSCVDSIPISDCPFPVALVVNST
jgi:hypothetical protein